jgi:hypothetical protein
VELEIQVFAIDLTHGEDWTFFPDDGTYAIAKCLTLSDLRRAVAEMTVHAQMCTPVTANIAAPAPVVPAPAFPYHQPTVDLSGLKV